jgi:hypothetical protein
MGLHQIPHIGDYVRYLRENPRKLTCCSRNCSSA